MRIGSNRNRIVGITALLGIVLSGCRPAYPPSVAYHRDVSREYASSCHSLPLQYFPTPAWADPVVSGETYDSAGYNPFRSTRIPGNDASTFSIDVDTASYANVRRMLMQNGVAPPAGAVRIEELVNYFEYDDAPPAQDAPYPFAVNVEMADSPWQGGHRLLRIGIKGKTREPEERPASNLVFLVDTSGSMADANKLPLLKESLSMLARQLDERDRIAIVGYSGSAGVALRSASGKETGRITRALRRLRPGGSTNGGEGIQLAYRIARENFRPHGNNRVVLCTDGDFNVGITERHRLVRLVEEEAQSGIDLTVLGTGMGNLKDGLLEQLTNQGNGNCFYIDGEREARKVLVNELISTLVTIARDVKIQVFFNPARVASWRLIGYENRRLDRQDFNDDHKDAGDIGAGHSLVALYEIVPTGTSEYNGSVDPNPYLNPNEYSSYDGTNGNLLRLRLRYKRPGESASILQEEDIPDAPVALAATSRDFRWSAAVAGFGMLLRNDERSGNLDWPMVRQLAEGAIGRDRYGFRAEFLALTACAERLGVASHRHPSGQITMRNGSRR